MTIEWGPIREHDGSAECPAEARDVACMVNDTKHGWIGKKGDIRGQQWIWSLVTAYRLPAELPAADPVLDALVNALERAVSLIRATEDGWHQKAAAALALAKGETK